MTSERIELEPVNGNYRKVTILWNFYLCLKLCHDGGPYSFPRKCKLFQIIASAAIELF
jgi:hypothetical protein